MISIRLREPQPRFDNMLKALGQPRAGQAINRAVNRAGDMTRTAMKQPLRRQTGLKAGTINKAMKVKRSNWRTLAYTITVRGGDIRLKHFAARETRSGVSAAPFGSRQRFAGAFMKGGRFPDRRPLNLGGQVFRRLGKGRTPIEIVRSGVVLPVEAARGTTIAAFEATGRAKLVERMAHELNRALSAAG